MRRVIDFISENKNTVAVVLCMVLMPVLLVTILQGITLQGAEAFVWWFGHPAAFVLSCLLVFAFIALLYGVFGRVSAAWLVCAIPAVALALINHFKMEINRSPFMISDFSMAGEIRHIASFALPQIELSVFTILMLVFVVVIFAGAVWVDVRFKTGGKKRLAVAAVSLGVVLVLQGFGVGAAWVSLTADGAVTQSERLENCGLLAGLYCAWSESQLYTVDDVSDEIRSQIREVREEKVSTEGVKPHVIFLMSESFFDVTRLDNITFKHDPIPNFHKLADTHTSGLFISNSYSGGTGYVEMEVLTGLCSNLLNEADTLTALPDKAYDEIPSISDVFAMNGYKRVFLHSYQNFLYNRELIYDAFDFETVRFSDSFPADASMSGGYVSDMALAEEIVAEYENKGDKRLMLYAVSMENHQPYNEDKYPSTSGTVPKSKNLSKDDMEIFESYLCGIVNADKALGYLTDYFSGVEEPVMLVFWGDHLPNLTLNGDKDVYEKLEYVGDKKIMAWEPDQLMKLLSTDYVIWTNYETEEQDAVRGNTMLGLDVAKMAGVELTDYYLWLDKYLSDIYVMHAPKIYVDKAGEPHSEIPEEYTEVMDTYRTIVRNIVYGKNDLFEKYR